MTDIGTPVMPGPTASQELPRLARVPGSTGLLDLTITVDRAAQLEAIACHASQSTHNRVLWHRLELLGNTEHLRYLRKAPE